MDFQNPDSPRESVATGSPGVPKTLGRKKIKIQRIQDDRNRQVTFLKRKNGLLKKAMELGVLCDCEVNVVIFNLNNGKLFEYSSVEAEKIFMRYATYNGPSERRKTKSFFDLASAKGVANIPKNEPLVSQAAIAAAEAAQCRPRPAQKFKGNSAYGPEFSRPVPYSIPENVPGNVPQSYANTQTDVNDGKAHVSQVVNPMQVSLAGVAKDYVPHQHSDAARRNTGLELQEARLPPMTPRTAGNHLSQLLGISSCGTQKNLQSTDPDVLTPGGHGMGNEFLPAAESRLPTRLPLPKPLLTAPSRPSAAAYAPPAHVVTDTNRQGVTHTAVASTNCENNSVLRMSGAGTSTFTRKQNAYMGRVANDVEGQRRGLMISDGLSPNSQMQMQMDYLPVEDGLGNMGKSVQSTVGSIGVSGSTGAHGDEISKLDNYKQTLTVKIPKPDSILSPSTGTPGSATAPHTGVATSFLTNRSASAVSPNGDNLPWNSWIQLNTASLAEQADVGPNDGGSSIFNLPYDDLTNTEMDILGPRDVLAGGGFSLTSPTNSRLLPFSARRAGSTGAFDPRPDNQRVPAPSDKKEVAN